MKILMSHIFYPRGGSAQVARYLSRALIELGHEVRLITGTLHDGDPQHDANVFFEDIPLTVVDYTDAWRGFEQGEDPLSDEWKVPFHPSYEDKPGVPDRVFYKLTDAEYAALLRCWTGVFEGVREHFHPDLIHLHHLTHAHVAAAQLFPSVPKLTQLHGTEIKMLEHLDESSKDSGSPNELSHLGRGILSDAVDATNHFAAISPDVCERAIARLAIDGKHITTIPNGVDTSLFQPLDWSPYEKWSFLRKILVEEPQGWDESGVPGSVQYDQSDIERLRDKSGDLRPLVIFVGRFLDFKRVPLLLRAVSQVNQLFDSSNHPPFNLLVWGGMPGEWEGEHPHTVARSLDLSNVFFCGWLPHDALSEGLNVADVLVAPSYNEPFGQVYIEAMATGVPVIATRSGGPLDFVVDTGPRANGWFCEVDDVDSLATTLHQVLMNETERKRRGTNALALIRGEYDWKEIARRYDEVYKHVIR
ncbi:MAG: glycosyltransferase family 4 protein [Gemmatimonadetes bacterium]|nr:glycosyltransferase family 4 protein [Gemmatimonadota bacterium]